MPSTLFPRAILLGLSIAAPVGPIGILCIRRTLSHGRLAGLVSGLGAATADGFYGCIAGFGLSVIATFLIHQSWGMRLIGGLFLCYLGIQTFRAKPAEPSATPTRKEAESSDQISSGKTLNLVSLYLSTLLLTLTNPMTILSFTAVFAGMGLVQTRVHYGDAALLVAGVFLGSALWWLSLSLAVWGLRSHLNLNHLRSLNWISGVILLTFGITALFSL